MSAQSAFQSVELIKKIVDKSIDEQVTSWEWLSPDERDDLAEALHRFITPWHAWIHARRLACWLKGDTKSGITKSIGIVVISNMLSALAENTTVENEGESRPFAVVKETKRLHKLILENITGQRQ